MLCVKGFAHSVYQILILNNILKQAIHTLVFGLIALFSLFKSVTSTNDISIPICVATTLEKYLLVPNNKITTAVIIPVIKFTTSHTACVMLTYC